MSHPDSPYQPHNDEISLVDLTKTLIQRWVSMAVIFTLVVVAALAYALSLPRTYQYVSLYQVAEVAPISALESPSSLVAKANNLYLGPLSRQMSAEQDWNGLPFDVSVNSPDETLLVRIITTAEPELAEQVEQFHLQLLERIQEGQEQLVERRRDTLEARLASSEEALEALEGSSAPGISEQLASYIQHIAELENKLADLQPGEINQVAIRSLEPTGQSRKLVLALGIVLGGVLAILGAFMMHFIGLVRASLKTERN